MSETAQPTTPTTNQQLQLLGPRLQLLENRYVTGLATAEVVTAQELEVLRASPRQWPGDLIVLLDERLAEATKQANDSFFRYDIRTVEGLAESSTFEITDCSTLASGLVDVPTRKLTILVAIAADGPEGTSLIRVPAFNKEQDLRPGIAYLFPAFAVPSFSIPEHATLSTVVLHAHGPSFR